MWHCAVMGQDVKSKTDARLTLYYMYIRAQIPAFPLQMRTCRVIGPTKLSALFSVEC